MNNYVQLKQTIEMFLRSEIQLVFRNTPTYESIKPRLPMTWQNVLASDTSIAQIIHYLWKDSAPLLKPFYQRLQERVIEVAIVITPSETYFAYIFQHENRFFTFLGGMPTTTEDIDKREKELGVMLPLNYQHFLSIHDGFLLDGWDSVGIRPLRKVSKIAELLEGNTTFYLPYNPNSLLGFCGDGGGNEQCFRYDGSGIPTDTVEWDHETRAMGKPMTFEAFLGEFLRRNLV